MVNAYKTSSIVGEVKEAPARSSWDSLWVSLCWLGVIVMLYLLSTGPSMMMIERGIFTYKSPGGKTADLFYRPAGWAYRSTLLHKPLGMYWHLWAPHLINS